MSHPDPNPGFAEAVAEATRFGRCRFVHPAPSCWWREVMTALDATAETMTAAEPAPSTTIAEAETALRVLLDCLARPIGEADLLHHAAARLPHQREEVARVMREGLPLFGQGIAALAREAGALSAAAPAAPPVRHLLHVLADLFQEAFQDHDGERAPATHAGGSLKGSPFSRFVAVALAQHEAAWMCRYSTPSPLAAALSDKAQRLALQDRPPGFVWNPTPGPG